MSSHTRYGTLFAVGALMLTGCSASPTERDFGDAVRHTMAQQRAAPAPAPAGDPTTDGVRMENVMSVYRSFVGDPSPVVREVIVEQGQGPK